MRLLIIEDNSLIAEALQRGLKTEFVVDTAGNGEEGLAKYTEIAYDAILLDLNLPDSHGSKICQALRDQKFSGPIIILTGIAAVNDKVAMLDMGADDYITKPFSLEEVKARLRATLRRTAPRTDKRPLAMQGLELDPVARTVNRDGNTIQLRRKEFDILEYLLRNEGKTLTRPMIMNHVWEVSDSVWANVIDVHVKHLRDKIDRPYGSHLLKTVHGLGYKLESNERA